VTAVRAALAVLGLATVRLALAQVSPEEAEKLAERYLELEPGLRFDCHLTESPSTSQSESEHYVFLCMPDPSSPRRSRPKLVFVHKETKEVSVAEAL
jgi:hypothetical protein